MKKIFYIILITQLTYSQSGWVRQNLSPNLELDGVYFTNEYTGYVGGSWYDTTILYKTTNAGLNWQSIFYYGFGGYATVCFLNDNTGLATCYGIIKTTNAGLNWDLKFHSPAILFSLVFPSTDTGYACGKYNTMIKTTNGGENWYTQVNNGGHHQNLCFVDNNTGFTVSEQNFVMKTTNGGGNWIMKSINDTAYLYSVAFINANTGFCGGWHYTNFYIAKTTNSGENWTENINGTNGRVYRMKFVNNQTGYAVGTAFLKTTNTGETWQIQEDLSGSIELYSVYFVNELTGYACGIDHSNNKGVLYKTTTGGEPIGIQPITNEVPKQFILNQNYPNPFNPVTKIKFDIPSKVKSEKSNAPLSSIGEGQGVRLIVYDILGREVAVLVNEQLNSGVYEVEWNGSQYSSGIYFYQLNITDASAPLSIIYSETKKMVLLK
jgi:photosystem II stability/assembly factor-like uncharacterized protein